MDITVIALFVIGVILLVLSFLLPAQQNDAIEKKRSVTEEEVADLVSKELQKMHGHVDDVVEQAVGQAVAKTQRSLEKLSNEKIMAVNEYSDSVMNDIHKNHEEVLFLYDMLNDKHKNLKHTVSEVNQTVKEVKELIQTEQEVWSRESVVSVSPQEIQTQEGNQTVAGVKSLEVSDIAKRQDVKEGTDTQASRGGEEINSNDRILVLFEKGNDAVTIAQQLDLGVGEVKLVIDLYRNKSE